MAGMNLHTMGIEPPPPPTRPLTAEERAVRDFVVEYGEEALTCAGCGCREWKRDVSEIWSRTQYADLTNVSDETYSAYGSQSAADFADGYDTEPWRCQRCNAVLRFTALQNLLEDIEKETF